MARVRPPSNLEQWMHQTPALSKAPPASIRSLIVTPRWSLTRGRLMMESKISFRARPRSVGIGTRRACSFPRRVITISSPFDARSTSCESYCSASKSPMVLMTNLLDS